MYFNVFNLCRPELSGIVRRSEIGLRQAGWIICVGWRLVRLASRTQQSRICTHSFCTYNTTSPSLYMELKLVYRGLRQISDWALRYYSEVHVDGQEYVPPDGPLIMCVATPTAAVPRSLSTTRP